MRLEPHLAKLGVAWRPSPQTTDPHRVRHPGASASPTTIGIPISNHMNPPALLQTPPALPRDLLSLSAFDYLLLIISMSSTREQIPPRRKRQHTEAGLSLDNPSESQPSKRLKSSRAEFYDSLSKVWLTRRALKELDRRTRQANSPQRPASAPRRVYRESTSKQIQRFARHGGPDLRDLRGVRLNCQSVYIISNQFLVSSSSRRRSYTRDSLQQFLPKQAHSIYSADDYILED